MARSAAAIMVRTVVVAVAVVWVDIVAAAAVEAVEVFEVAVAGANGTVGRFRSVGDIPDAR